MKYQCSFWTLNNTNIKLLPFSKGHTLCLIVIFFFSFLIYLYKDTINNSYLEKLISYSIAFILILHQISLYTWYIYNNKLTLKECLPLYPCRISVILSIIIMFNKSTKVFDILYFWGIGGASIALLFHDTSLYPFPHYIFIQFFISHGGILLSVLFMIFVHGYLPTFSSFKRTLKWTFLYFLFTIPINYLIDSNYCYLRENHNLYIFKYTNQNSILISLCTVSSFFILFYLLYLPYKNKEHH